MVRYFIYPLGMPSYNAFPVEVSREQFDKLATDLAQAKLHISTDFELFAEQCCEKWYIDYNQDGKWSGYQNFGYSLSNIGEFENLPQYEGTYKLLQ